MFNQHYSNQRQTKKVLRLRFSLRQDKRLAKVGNKADKHSYNTS